jgi:uncharacterized protein
MNTTGYPPGTPCWVDIVTPDLAGAKEFYGALFGWKAVASPDLDAATGTEEYVMFAKDGQLVAGALQPAMAGLPPTWNIYFSTADTAAAVKAVEAAGGQVHRPPTKEFDQGVSAVCSDAEGAVFSLWQPVKLTGMALTDAPGSFCWSEVATRDPDSAKDFYPAVFGWTPVTTDHDGAPCTQWTMGDRSVAGMMLIEPPMPDHVPPHWLVYFMVDDLKESMETVTRLGGRCLSGPMDIGIGLSAVLKDPSGPVFGVMEQTRHGENSG